MNYIRKAVVLGAIAQPLVQVSFKDGFFFQTLLQLLKLPTKLQQSLKLLPFCSLQIHFTIILNQVFNSHGTKLEIVADQVPNK